MGALYSIRKSWRLRKLSKALAQPIRTVEELLQGSSGSKNRTLDALLDLCQSDPAVAAVMSRFNQTRDHLRAIYWDLMANGAGQWASLHWVAASTIAFGTTLQFYLENEATIPLRQRIVLLLEYFERNESGPVPIELRGPIDPNDPLSALWKER